MKDSLSFISLIQENINLSRDVVWLVFVIACALAALLSAVLFFHWRMYGMKNYRIILAELIFLAGLILIVMFAFSSALEFTQ